MPTRRTPAESLCLNIILPLTDVLESCWLWRSGRAYPRIKVEGRFVLAHRYSYERFIAPIPEGLVVDHLCRNPKCVNPTHVEPVTQQVNNLRGLSPCAMNARKDRCQHGHLFTPENSYYRPSQSGKRCRECCRAYGKARHEQAVEWVVEKREALDLTFREVRKLQLLRRRAAVKDDGEK